MRDTQKKTEQAGSPPVAIVYVVAVVDIDCKAVRLDGGKEFLGLEVLVALSAHSKPKNKQQQTSVVSQMFV